MRIWFTDVHWLFIDNVVDGAGDDIQCGTWIEDTVNGAIVDCEFLNRHSGMVLLSPENLTISGNYVHDATLNGIDVMKTMTNCEITDNIIEDVNGRGIQVHGVTCSKIIGNEISDCGGIGIHSFGGLINSEIKMNQISDIYSEGIYFGNAMNSEISFNSIVDAEDAGIIGMGVNTCNMRNNTVSNITGVGISVDYCQQSDISMNDI
ncbi:MAG: right-handed parallel beta-helix repeat-containing protein [Candidatus Thorarchaeota archaeon]